MATAEFAIALPAVVLVLALVVGMADVLLQRHRAAHAAAVGARVAARGESAANVAAAVRATGLHAASVTMTPDGRYVRVSVSLEVTGLGWALSPVSQEVVAVVEQAADDDYSEAADGAAERASARRYDAGTSVSGASASAVTSSTLQRPAVATVPSRRVERARLERKGTYEPGNVLA